MRKSIECKKEIKIRDELDSVSVARRRRRRRQMARRRRRNERRANGTKVEGVDHGERGEHGEQVAKAEGRKRKKQRSEEDDSPLLLLAVWRVSRTANVPVMWASTVASTTSAR